MIVNNNASMKRNMEIRNNLERDNNIHNSDEGTTNNTKFDAFNNGSQFFNMGGKLENASGDLKASKDFIDGYNRAQRVSNIRNGNSGGR